MKKRIGKIIAGITGVMIMILFLLFAAGAIGVSTGNIEADARKSQNIDEGWEASISTSDKLCAMIFYNEKLDNYVYSIYVNRTGLSIGWFFFEGGGESGIADSVCDFHYDNKGIALVSMNKDEVAKIELDHGGKGIEEIDVDPNKPFAIVLPENPGAITLFNDEGATVPMQ